MEEELKYLKNEFALFMHKHKEIVFNTDEDMKTYWEIWKGAIDAFKVTLSPF